MSEQGAAPIRVALAGPMGAGKSTVGQLLAERWSVPFVDLDGELGDIPAVFAREGEAGFRRREHAALARIVPGVGVLALGGGALVAEANRALLSAWRVFVLTGSAGTLRARIGEGEGRPLAAELERLLIARADLWEVAGPNIETDGLSPSQVADRVEALCAFR